MAEQMRVTVNKHALRCQHCGHQQFIHKTATLPHMALGGFAYLQGSWGHAVAIYACGSCGFAHFFMPVPNADHQFGEKSPIAGEHEAPKANRPFPDDGCLSCGKPIPAEATQCPACGWTWQAEEVENS